MGVDLSRIRVDISNVGVLYVGFYFMDIICRRTDACLSKHHIMGIDNLT